ncbi:hypothetical protein PN483_00005 [Nodularia spumigena CS-591/04]|nr:hypothetical protein [Nodularia spumigena CS-590/01A]MDB9323001.1 hypothetical protein [Nodularia spumigena CS-591/07A]MDB9328904.1 hypothetical protein [Nodularia spumigena CS-591/04]
MLILNAPIAPLADFVSVLYVNLRRNLLIADFPVVLLAQRGDYR